MTEPLACCVHGAMETSQVKPGETVLIFGPGAMGLLTGMVCKSQGAKVVIAGLTKDEKRFEVARTLGFDRIVDQMKAAEGVTEELKRKDAMLWVQRCNNIRNRAEEIVLNEMVYI